MSVGQYFLGFDTSCYTTSIACVNEDGIVCDERTVLSVQKGNRGLRQSEALFQHVRNLPLLMEKLFSVFPQDQIALVSYSATPTCQQDSYMPVFLAGKSTATAVACARHVPLFAGDHQMGHVRAALFGNEFLMEKERILALHLSGGTSDLLSVRMEDGIVGAINAIGSSGDLHVGQFVDRIGVLLDLPFPCGKHLEPMARNGEGTELKIPSSVNGLNCSFSGAETNARRLIENGAPAEEVAYAVYEVIARSVARLIVNAVNETGVNRVLLSGGVASSLLLRELLKKRLLKKDIHLYFGRPELSSDNAVGIALAGRDRYVGGCF